MVVRTLDGMAQEGRSAAVERSRSQWFENKSNEKKNRVTQRVRRMKRAIKFHKPQKLHCTALCYIVLLNCHSTVLYCTVLWPYCTVRALCHLQSRPRVRSTGLPAGAREICNAYTDIRWLENMSTAQHGTVQDRVEHYSKAQHVTSQNRTALKSRHSATMQSTSEVN
jgi:hypothetical protein